jgi:hypothetical protein
MSTLQFKTSWPGFLGELVLIAAAFCFAIFTVFPNLGTIGVGILFILAIISHLDEYCCFVCSKTEVLILRPYSVFSKATLLKINSILHIQLMLNTYGQKLVFDITNKAELRFPASHISRENLNLFAAYLRRHRVKTINFG